MNGVRRLLAPDGVFVFEVSYLADVVKHPLFDTIYHEHLCYPRWTRFVGFFARHGLELIEALRVDSHGGSLRGVVQLKGGPRSPGGSVAAMVAQEEAAGLDRPETFHAFAGHIASVRDELLDLLRKLKANGKRSPDSARLQS